MGTNDMLSRSARAATGLRLAGASYGEVAEVLGFATAVEARESVEGFLGVAGGSETEERARLRAEESARIERLLRSVWSKATSEADPEHLPAVKVALSLVDRHARLWGLDAPTEVVVHSPTTSEIDSWVTQMTSHGQLGLENVVEADVVS